MDYDYAVGSRVWECEATLGVLDRGLFLLFRRGVGCFGDVEAHTRVFFRIGHAQLIQVFRSYDA
jgi:hypothetical protein